MNKMTPPIRTWAGLIVIGVATLLRLPCHAGLSFDFDNSFSGSPPTTAAPWMNSMLSQYTVNNQNNQIELDISLPGTLPSGTFLDTFYLNFDPGLTKDISFLTVAPLGAANPLISYAAAEDGFKADGDGYYDIKLSFPTIGTGRFVAGQTASFIITDPNSSLSPVSFLFTSTMGGGAGTWLMAGHLQGYGNGAWVAAPEPNFALIAGLLLMVGAGVNFLQTARWGNRRTV